MKKHLLLADTFDGFTIQNTGIILDFDRTLSTGGSPTSFGVFHKKIEGIHENISTGLQTLYNTYRPIELDSSLGDADKKDLMRQWAKSAFSLVQDHNLDHNSMQQILEHAKKSIQIRNGFSDFLTFTHTNSIPVLVYSAGVRNVVDAIIEYNILQGISTHGNLFGFDRKGNNTGLVHPVIHTENKDWGTLPNEHKELFSDRTHMIIMGDSLSDKKMAPSLSEKEQVRTIGILVNENAHNYGIYREHFDEVIRRDDSDEGMCRRIEETLKINSRK